MPELPEVDSFKRVVERAARGKTVSRAIVHDPRIVRHVSARQFCLRLRGAKLKGTRRHVKYLLVALDRSRWLVEKRCDGI